MKALFSTSDIARVFESQLNRLREEIGSLSADYLASTAESELVVYLRNKYELTPPTIGEAYIENDNEVRVDVSKDPRRMIFDRTKPFLIPGQRIEIHIPFEGDSQLFSIAPSHRAWTPPEVNEVRHDCLALIFEGANLNPEQIRTFVAKTIDEIKSHLRTMQSDCDKSNAGLDTSIRQALTTRKERLALNTKVVQNIGLPIRRRENAPMTYIVPDVRSKPKIERPVATDKPTAREPELAQQEYEHILGVVRGMVHVIERSPKAFLTMQEEDLRTHFLVQLNGQYEGRASGETFNYQGKTDILIREGDRNVFIAECAFWKGEAYLTEKINQILSYLHWRDTKTSLIVFNRNKSFSDVLSKVEPTVKSHTCCKKLLNKNSDTEWRFLFRNADDPNRELQLTVMFFDVPKGEA